METKSIFTVSEITRYLKEKIDWDPILQNIAVRGEISNFVHHSSGHMYFTLKDNTSRLKCVMFRGKNIRLPFALHNGLKIVALGDFSIFERDGYYQLYVNEIQPEGIGSLHLAFVQLRDKLEKEGLFALERKKRLPVLPYKIGVITSPTGAAIRDILNVIQRRMPLSSILIIPAAVQGKEAVSSLVQALSLAQKIEDKIDVLIIGRGGGSLEELWAFNEEEVVRAIARCTIPIVSAVGHETDFTIADFVADQRAPTPSAAAELVTPDSAELSRHLRNLEARLLQSIKRKLHVYHWKLESLRQRPVLIRPQYMLANRQQALDYLREKQLLQIKERIKEKRAKLHLLVEKLNNLSPLAILERGYSVCYQGEKLVKSVSDLQKGDSLTVIMLDGKADCLVQDVRGEER